MTPPDMEVVRGGVEPPTFRFSGAADAQFRQNVRE